MSWFRLSCFFRSLILGAIKTYQLTLSPDHGLFQPFFPDGCCRFYPSCSQYGLEAVRRHGTRRGLVLALWRVLRCNPWNRHYGPDPVPSLLRKNFLRRAARTHNS